MDPFFLLDLLNCGSLGCVPYGLPVAAIRETGGKLASVRSLENVNEVTAMALVIHSGSTASVTAKAVPREPAREIGSDKLQFVVASGLCRQTERRKEPPR